MIKVVFGILLLAFLYAPPRGEEYITFEQFGAKGNGMDETEMILQALMQAKAARLPVKLMGKTYKFSPKSNLDITGIPAITGQGTIDLSQTGPDAGYKSMTHVFTVKGEKQLLQHNLGITKYKSSVFLAPELKLQPGDILFITSAEPLPNRNRKYNCKGQRSIVKSYDRSSGELTITEPFYFDISNAFIWKNTVRPKIEIGEEVTFITGKMNFVGCLEIVYADAVISGSYKNFALAAISLRSSEGYFYNVRSELPITSNNGYSYGISVADMSNANIKNCTLNGGRHTVTGTGGGLWKKSESGGPDEPAGYPATLEINGGTYTGSKHVNGISEDIGTIDSHGNVQRMVIRNCTVYGGINLGANYAEVDSVTIYTDTKRAFNFGSDVQPGSDWGHYTVKNTVIKVNDGTKKSILLTKSDVISIHLQNIIFEGIDDHSLIADFRYPAPKKLEMEQIIWADHDKIPLSPRFLVNKNSRVTLDEISCLKMEDIKKY